MFDDRTPIYRQIAGQLREDIVGGLLDDDEQVMSTNQYASFHRINPATVAKAFQELVDDGVLYKRRGLGMFVSPGAGERLRADRRSRFFDDVLGPVIAEARRLGIPTDEVVDAIRDRAAEVATTTPTSTVGSSTSTTRNGTSEDRS